MPQIRAPHRVLHGHLARRRASHSYGYVLLMIGAIVLLHGDGPGRRLGDEHPRAAAERDPVRRALDIRARARRIADEHLPSSPSRCWSPSPACSGRARPAAGLLALLTGVLTIAVVVVLALSIVDQGEINAQSITDAICVYLLLGMIFLFVYGAAASLGDGAFFAQGTDGTRALRLYFSYVTLATLGYGDYTPAGNFGHAVAIIEALFGQLYLVTVVAVLVSRMRPRRALDE